MRFLKSILERLLGVAVRVEQSSRERHLEKQLRRESQKRLREQADTTEERRVLNADLNELHVRIGDLEKQIESRDHTIKEKDHEIALLQMSVDGLNALVARQQRWIESERIAESRPLEAEDQIDPAIMELARRLSANTWETLT